MRKYFYTDGETKFGPFSKEELQAQKISRHTKVWYFGLSNWTQLSQITELEDVVSTLPPNLRPQNNLEQNDIESSKKKIIGEISPANPRPKKLNLNKWFSGIAILFATLLVVFVLIRNQSEAKLRKEVVANSFNSEENFNIYIEKFYRDLEHYGISPKKPEKTIVKFSKLDQLDNTTHIHALSLGLDNDKRIEIYINPSSWKRFTKPMRYFLMYHELAHDVLNLDDLDNKPINEGKLMYPEISSYEKKNMDDFIESFHNLFEEQAKKRK